MLDTILGNVTAAKVILFLYNYKEGYATEIAKTFNVPLNPVQKQLQRFEKGGSLVSVLKGKTRMYTWNPRYFLKNELQSLCKKSLSALSEKELKSFYRQRRRPRRIGKAL